MERDEIASCYRMLEGDRDAGTERYLDCGQIKLTQIHGRRGEITSTAEEWLQSG